MRPSRPSSAWLTRARRLVAATIVVAVVALGGGPAHADPSVAEIEAELDRLWEQAEPLIEQYNEVRERYQQNKARQEELTARIEPLQAQLDAAYARVGEWAAQAYLGGQADPLQAILAAGSPGDLADQLTYLDQLAREQRQQVAEVARLKREYDQVKEPIDALVAELAWQESELERRRVEIEARLDEMQQLRVKAYGEEGITGGPYRPSICPAEYLPTKGYQAAVFACNQTGDPYVWAASGPDAYDCSGLTLRAWRQVGVYLPHNAAMQRRSMPYVSREDLQIGDLVFYYSDLHHVAIYVGNGMVVHAPRSGDRVRMAPIDRNRFTASGGPADAEPGLGRAFWSCAMA